METLDAIGLIKKRKPKYTKGNFLKGIVGVRFGKLVIKEVNENKYGYVIAICDCGKEKEYIFQNIKQGKTTSCGCVAREIYSKHMTEYNRTRPPIPIKPDHLRIRNGISFHPLFKVWQGMRSRCYKEYDISYKRYGGKGVIICDGWRYNYRAFYEWAIANGWKKGLQIDKDIKAKELGLPPLLYSPERCMFITRSKNCRLRTTSKFIEYHGITKTLVEWCEVFGITHTLYLNRIKRGWDSDRAFETPSLKVKKAV